MQSRTRPSGLASLFAPSTKLPDAYVSGLATLVGAFYLARLERDWVFPQYVSPKLGLALGVLLAQLNVWCETGFSHTKFGSDIVAAVGACCAMRPHILNKPINKRNMRKLHK